jgi:two-component system sensor histidine kinase RpfC
MSLLNSYYQSKLKNNQEFQSSMVRLLLWFFVSIHIFISSSTGHLPGDFDYFFWILVISLLLFTSILISILIRPVWPGRLVVSMSIDIVAITVCLIPSEDAFNTFTLVYLWVVVSYSARYGKKYLLYSALGSALGYSGVVITKGIFIQQPTEVIFFLIFLFALPVYQYMIISGRIAAEQATEVKNRFLSTMTHELRTPLSGVIGMSRLLDSTKLDNEQQEYVKSIQSASEVLMSLIGDILDFSKIEAKRLEVNKSSVDIRRCIGAVCQLLSSRAEDKHLELICRIDDDVPSIIQTDEIRIKQILYNLLGNAIKFTEQGEVEIWVSTTDEHPGDDPRLLIKIRDTGPGIPADKLKRIFEGFWQENLSITRRHGGTGLGTTISLELARLLGGEVDVDSTQGVGTTFCFILPMASGTSSPPPERQKLLAGHSFLVVEHNLSCNEIISNILHTTGANAVYKHNLPDITDISAIILSDAPDPMDLNTIVKSQMDSLGTNVPVLVLGYASRKYRLDIPEYSLLVKPFLSHQLTDALVSLLSTHPAQSHSDTEILAIPECTDMDSKKILVAEDEPINAKLIHVLLTKKGHDTTLVKNGTQALELLSERRFDLAILDVRMPGMDGIEVTKRVRLITDVSINSIPIVALTASALNDIKETCLTAGMDDFLLKPINPDVLDELIERFT